MDRMAEAYGIPESRGRDAELARRLEVKSKTVQAWRARNTVDHDVIIDRCEREGFNVRWVLTGNGEKRLLATDATERPAEETRKVEITLGSLDEELEQAEAYIKRIRERLREDAPHGRSEPQQPE